MTTTAIVDGLIVDTEYMQIDALNTSAFQEELKEVASGHRNIILDFSSVRFIDSSGLGSILGIYRAMSQRGGALVICSANSAVTTLFDMVKLSQIIPCFSNRQEAIAYLEVN